MLPIVSRTREQARQVVCISNLRSLSLAIITYCHENSERFPTPAVGGAFTYATDWVYWQPGQDLRFSRIAHYLGTSFAKTMLCPSDEVQLHVKGNPRYPFSYTLNEYMARTLALNHPIPIHLTQIQYPAEKIMLIDESSGSIDDGCWAPQNYPLDGRNILSNRHDKRTEITSNSNAGFGNVAFADGHAAFVPRLDTTKPALYVAYPGEPDR